MTTQKIVLDGEDAACIGEAALARAREMGLDVSIAIVDDGGHLLWLRRAGAASPSTARIAEGKAQSAALTRRPTKFYEDMLSQRTAFLSAPGIGCLLEGGVPVVEQAQCLGAVGVSGARSSDDVAIAEAGIAALRNPRAREAAGN